VLSPSFTVADVYLLFKDRAVDFKGFLELLKQVGERLGTGSQFLVTLAEAADSLEVAEQKDKYPRISKIGSGLPLTEWGDMELEPVVGA